MELDVNQTLRANAVVHTVHVSEAYHPGQKLKGDKNKSVVIND